MSSLPVGPDLSQGRPLAGVKVVEVARGTSELGLGLAGGLPGMLLADLGAEVTRIVDDSSPPIDAGLAWGRAWHRDKTTVSVSNDDDVVALLAEADVALVYGSERRVEGRGLGWVAMQRTNPGLVYARCRPSVTEDGEVADYGLLVEARAGFCAQLGAHRDGPMFVDVRATASGAAFLLTASTLALLRRRALVGEGGWADTSLYDGMLATLGCMIGRSERAAPEIEQYWEKGSWFPNFLYRCADGELLQLWFGGKGMYDKLIEVLGDEPSEAGYYADQSAGRLNDRAIRWREIIVTRPRDHWIEQLRAAGVAAEPVNGPGQVLSDPHARQTGLALTRSDAGHHDVVVGSPITVGPLDPDRTCTDAEALQRPTPLPGPRGLLDGIRVVDFSMFVAGPLAAQVLADFGADVIKIEPPQGEAMRGAAYAMAACQRGKRSLAIDINAPDARPVVDRLLRWADVVVHNFRVGVSERLGIDEATVARVNPTAVYCHASAFGATGPRAKLPGNDALMQAVTGFERAVGGAGNDPTAATWIPIDMSGGWIAAAGILAGLYARSRSGRGQRVSTSLLGAGMLLQSGVFERDGRLVEGPCLDADQTGFGPGYRIYQTGDGRWLAVVIPDEKVWAAVGSLTGLGSQFIPLRGVGAGAGQAGEQAARQAEDLLERALADGSAAEWSERLAAAGALVEPVGEPDRDGFRRGILDDSVNRQLGRVSSYRTDDWGGFEQIGPLVRSGPAPASGPYLRLPGIGAHSAEVLADLGFEASEIDALLAAKVVKQL